MKKVLFVFCVVFVFQSAVAQNGECWLLNGKKISMSNYKIDNSNGEDSVVFYTNHKGKSKNKYVSDIYSINDTEKGEIVLYKKNEDFGNILTPDEMRSYLQGLTDVLENYKTPAWVLAGGVVSGAIGVFTPSPSFALGSVNASFPVGILVPTAYVAIVGATSPNLDKVQESMPNKIDEELYKVGLQDGVRKKRLKNSLIGSAVGFVAGFVTLSIIAN